MNWLTDHYLLTGFSATRTASFERRAVAEGHVPSRYMLLEWSKCRSATVAALVAALTNIGRTDLVAFIYTEPIYTASGKHRLPLPHPVWRSPPRGHSQRSPPEVRVQVLMWQRDWIWTDWMLWLRLTELSKIDQMWKYSEVDVFQMWLYVNEEPCKYCQHLAAHTQVFNAVDATIQHFINPCKGS